MKIITKQQLDQIIQHYNSLQDADIDDAYQIVRQQGTFVYQKVEFKKYNQHTLISLVSSEIVLHTNLNLFEKFDPNSHCQHIGYCINMNIMSNNKNRKYAKIVPAEIKIRYMFKHIPDTQSYKLKSYTIEYAWIVNGKNIKYVKYENPYKPQFFEELMHVQTSYEINVDELI